MANVKATDLIDFTRASKGHALAKVSYGSELVVNGGFDTDISGWTVSGATVTFASGEMQIERTGSGQYVTQAITTETGKVYSYSVYARNGTTSANALVGSSILGGENLSVSSLSSASGKTFTFTFLATGTTTYITYTFNSLGTCFVDNISVKEVLFNQPDGTLQLFEHPNNTPRIEYDADGNLLGLLIEESRTNEIPSSQQFDVATWAKGGSLSVTDNVVTAPDGTQTGCLVTAVDDTTDYLVRSAVVSNGQTKSIWARTVSGTGKVTLLGHNSVSAAMFDLTETWQRFDLPADTGQTGGSNFYAVDFRGTAATLTEVYIWGAQLEEGSFPTSYIKTQGSTVSRAADVASIDVDQFGYNKNEGSWIIESQVNANVINTRLAVLTDGQQGSRILSAGYSSYQGFVSDNGTTVNITTGSFPVDTPTKLGFGWATNNSAISLDGSDVVTDLTCTIPTSIDYMTLGSNYIKTPSGSAVLHIKSINYYPKRLSNAKLQELTS